MTPIYETGRFPRLFSFLRFTTSIAFGCVAAYTAIFCWQAPPLAFDYNGIISFALTCVVGGIAFVAVWISTGLLIRPIVNHAVGKEIFNSIDNYRPVYTDVYGNITLSSSVYADAYAITTAYTLPYAHNFYTKKDGPYCELFLSFSYAELLDLYRFLRRTHRVRYHILPAISLPSHLGKRKPVVSRGTLKTILQEIEAAGPDPATKRVVFCYGFYPSYHSPVDLPNHQVFLSKDIISELLSFFPAARSDSPDATITVKIDTDQSISLTARYLRECYQRIASDNEFIYIPITNG